MKRAVVAALVALSVAGCGEDTPRVPEHGLVIDADYTPAWMQWMPGTTSCSGNPPVCITSPGYPIFWPERWDVTVRDLNNPDWTGTVEVDQAVYNRCNLRELWPECSREGAGDVRQDERP